MIAVFADGSPSRKQRPNRTEVISGPVVDFRVLRDDAHAPIGLMIFSRRVA